MSKAQNVETPSDRCRICRCNFRVKFGNISQPGKSRFISSENLFKESKRSGYIGTILADICRAVGVEVVENSQLYSDRVCNPCARKIRNLGTLFELIRNTIGSQSAVTQTPPKLAENLSKRLLDTTPGRSPCRKTVRVNSPESVKASRKSLRFDAIPQPSDQDKNDLLDSNLNIDNLTPGEELRVKVVIVNSSGNVTTRIPRDEESKQLVRQLCNKNWQAAANSIINKQAYLNPVQVSTV